MLPLWSDEVEKRVQARAYNLDPVETPDDLRFCTKCVISNQRPRITFDEDGVCSACRFAEYKETIDWEAREQELGELLNFHRRTVGYDVVVPCSGGKDSAFVAGVLKNEYGMNPLCVKWAPFIYTDIGRRNFEQFSEHGFDTMEVRPNGLIHRKLARLSLEYLGEPFQPFIYGQLAVPMRVAEQFGIKLVFFGENGEAEYGGDQSANNKPCWGADDWERIYLKQNAVDDLLMIGHELGAFDEVEMRAVSEFYRMPDARRRWAPEFHWMSYYKKWHPQGNYYYATKHTGFEPNPEGRSEGTYSKYASIDDKLDGLHYFFGYLKFGIGRCTSDAAHEVRDGEITREEAKALVRQYDGEYPERYLDECLEYLGMDRVQLDRVMRRFTRQFPRVI